MHLIVVLHDTKRLRIKVLKVIEGSGWIQCRAGFAAALSPEYITSHNISFPTLYKYTIRRCEPVLDPAVIKCSHMNPQLITAINKIRTGKTELFLQIILVFVIPIMLLDAHVVPLKLRSIFLIACVVLLLIILSKERWTLSMLGIQKTGFRQALIPYLIFTAIGFFFISQLGERIGREELAAWWRHPHFLYLFLIVSVFQEIAYRGYLIPALGKVSKSPLWILLCNTLLFVFLHTIFPGLLFNLPLAFLGGLGFAIIYMKYPNLPLIIISHSILNFVAVLYGFFIVPGLTY